VEQKQPLAIAARFRIAGHGLVQLRNLGFAPAEGGERDA
jgi:hypothetical protein